LEALDAFKAANVQVMVATDVAARGLDIDDLPLVVNYEMPYVPEDYIHRIGRTGRAGQAGEAISLCAPEEEKLLAEIERLLKRSIPVAAAETFVASQPLPHARSSPSSHSARNDSRRGTSPAAPRRDRAHAEIDRNPDQPKAVRAHEGAHAAALTSGSHAGSHSSRRHRPIPALLMKRRTPEPESA
jgi:ATP-dependent RNA helicase RhlE